MKTFTNENVTFTVDDDKWYDSCYSIALDILNAIKEGSVGALIDDTTISTEKVWSSSKVMQEISGIPHFDIQIVQELPETGVTGTVYLVPAESSTQGDVYDEYLYLDGQWEHIGSTIIDLSNYYTKDQIDLYLSGKQNTLTAGANIQLLNGLISATDTTYTASDFDIKDLSDSTGLRTKWNNKQDTIIAGANVQIDGTTISATDTTYTASDFDIKDLSDSTGLRTKWNNKQDTDTAVTHTSNTQVGSQTEPVYIGADGKATPIGFTIQTSVPQNAVFTDTTYSAGTNVSISNGVISAIDTTYTNATQSEAGLMSPADKTKLDGLVNYVLPTASANVKGGIKVGSGLSIDANGVLSANPIPAETYTATQPLYIDENKNISIDLSDYLSESQADLLYNPINTTTANASQSASSVKLPTWNANGQITGSAQVYGNQLNINGTLFDSLVDSTPSPVVVYVPTTVGTAGQVLKSSGSGAPYWSDNQNVDLYSIDLDIFNAASGTVSNSSLHAFVSEIINTGTTDEDFVLTRTGLANEELIFKPSSARVYDGNLEIWLMYMDVDNNSVTYTLEYYVLTPGTYPEISYQKTVTNNNPFVDMSNYYTKAEIDAMLQNQ